MFYTSIYNIILYIIFLEREQNSKYSLEDIKQNPKVIV